MSYMQLKVAEYKNEKFVGFLEQSKLEMGTFFDQEGGSNDVDILSNGFLLGENYIQIISRDKDFDIYTDEYKLDEKDPLNRFGGIFNNRSYGEGRFILVKDGDFGVYEQKLFDKKHEEFGYGLSLDGKISCTFKNTDQFVGKYASSTLPKLIGNLIENPELWEKVK